MRTGMVACCIGIGAVAWAPQLPAAPMLLAGWLIALVFVWRRTRAASFALSLLFGLSWATFYGQGIVNGLLPAELEQQPLSLSGRISGLIDTSERFGRPAQRFTLRVDACQLADGEPCGVALHTVQLTTTQPLTLASGERWRFPVRLKRPHGFANPGGFDFESWQIQQGIGAVGSVTSAAAQRLAPAQQWSVDRWRGTARDRLQQRLASFAHGDLLLALLVADGSAIERTQWQLFRDTGTIHLFVVSGSHIALTGGLVWWLANLWRRLPWANGSRREQMLCALPALLAAMLYALLAGMGLPIQRALIMFAVLIVSASWRREMRLGDALLLALTLVLLRDPLAARDAGCWFSFVAVAVLGVALSHDGESRDGEARDGEGKNRWRWARAQWLIFISCVPILMLIGSPLTGLSLPANAVAVPLTTLLTLPAALMALLCEPLLPMLASWCWRGADFSLQVLLQWLEFLRAHGGWLIAPLVASPARVALAALAVLLWLLPRGIGTRLLAPVLLLPALWPPPSDLPAGALRISVLDVGQGLSVLVETKTHRLLYDTGPAFPGGASAAEFAVLPALSQRGVRALDLLMVSHRDNDHAGGVDDVREALTVRQMSVGEALRQPLAANFCSAGQRWRWDDVDFTVLSPQAVSGGRGNNRSCVLRIDAGLSSVLLAGDIEARIEAGLRDALTPVSLLVAPHHGSRTSSSLDFVAAMRPRYVVFSSGYRNRFGHPHPVVVDRYRAGGAQTFSTAQSGALDFTLRRNGVVSITEFRKERRHYWDEPVKSPPDLTGISGPVLHLPGISRSSASEPAHAQ